MYFLLSDSKDQNLLFIAIAAIVNIKLKETQNGVRSLWIETYALTIQIRFSGVTEDDVSIYKGSR